MVLVTFQSIFQSEMHQNNIFFIFLKIIIEISKLKWCENTKQKNINLKQKK